MKRLSSAPRSYLQQLAAPLPQPAALVHARHPVARGVGSVLDAIPPVVESVDSARTFADRTRTARPSTEPPIRRNATLRTPQDALSDVSSGLRTSSASPDAHGDAISPPLVSAAARPVPASVTDEDVAQQVVPRRNLGQRSAATGESTPQRSARFDPEPAAQPLDAPLRPLLVGPSSQTLASSSANSTAEAKGGGGAEPTSTSTLAPSRCALPLLHRVRRSHRPTNDQTSSPATPVGQPLPGRSPAALPGATAWYRGSRHVLERR